MDIRRITPIQSQSHSATSFRPNRPGHPSVCFITGFRQTYLTWVPVFILLLQARTIQAQFDPTIQQNAAEMDSTRGYWRLKTQAATRSTLVQFFGPDNQLLYVENLPEKWVKLSRKNQKQFDQLLEQLLANQLVTSRIKTEILPPTPELTTPPRVTVRSNSPQTLPLPAVSYRVHAYVNSAGKLYLIVDNPDHLRYKILVADQKDRVLYEEFTNHDQYRRKLDLSGLPTDFYQVTVQIDNKPFIYKIRRQDARFAYSIQPQSFPNPPITIEQNRKDDKPSFMPVSIDL